MMAAVAWTKEIGNAEARRTQRLRAAHSSALSAPRHFKPTFPTTQLDQLIWANLEDIGYGG